MKTSYTLTREGNGRVLCYRGLTRRQALQSVGHSLVDNGHASKADAQRFAATIQDGISAKFGPYVFTVTP